MKIKEEKAKIEATIAATENRAQQLKKYSQIKFTEIKKKEADAKQKNLAEKEDNSAIAIVDTGSNQSNDEI